MTKAIKTYTPGLLCLAVMGLAACGGGGGGSTSGSDLSPTGSSAAPSPAPGVTPVPPILSAASSSSGCFNLDLKFTAGTKSKIQYITEAQVGVSATKNVTYQIDESTAVGDVSLSGETVFRTDGKLTGYGAAPSKYASTGVTVDYSVRTGPTTVKTLRTESTGTGTDEFGNPFSASTVNVFGPAGEVFAWEGMAVGASIEQVSQGTSTQTYSPPGTTTTKSFDDTAVVKFVGIENVTVPAGTYETCLYERFEKVSPATVTRIWIIRGAGLSVKSTLSVSGVPYVIMQATSVELNGKKL
jgi:hypothetical protein